MKRRRLLAVAGITISTTHAGCIDDGSPADGTQPGRTNGDDDGNDDPKTIEEDPRIDTPPYEIEPPETPDEDRSPPDREAEWDEEYLGEHMETEPSVSYEPIPYWLDDPYRLDPKSGGSVFRVGLVGDRVSLTESFDLERLDDEERAEVEGIDFERLVVVVVQSGFGSGSVAHRWGRIEKTDDGIHLHGYYTDPLVKTDDLTSRSSVLKVERPDGSAKLARVSLTTDESTRVHFNSTEGLVELEE